MVLVDTSVWVDFLNKGDQRVATLLEQSEIVCHPFILGELACGNLRNRNEVLGLLASLRQTTKAEDTELLAFIKKNRLFGKGLTLVDVHLLASALLSKIPLWTRDKQLHLMAQKLGAAL